MLNKNIAGFFVVLFAGVSAFPATILMDYNDQTPGDGHDLAIRDGGFENTTVASGVAKFSETPNWVNLADKDEVATKSIQQDGRANRIAVIARSSSQQPRLHAQSLEYLVANADQFKVHFKWKNEGKWPPTGRVNLALYYTEDNTPTGQEIDSIVFAPEDPAKSQMTLVEFDPQSFSKPIPAGKQLMVRFFVTGGFPKQTRYASFDDVFIEVNRPKIVSLVGLSN